MAKDLLSRLFPNLTKHLEMRKYEKEIEVEYNKLSVEELMEIIRRYDGMSLKDRLLLPEKDIINYQAAERTIRKKEGRQK